MISEGLLDWSDDAENPDLPSERDIFLYFKIFTVFFKLNKCNLGEQKMLLSKT